MRQNNLNNYTKIYFSQKTCDKKALNAD